MKIVKRILAVALAAIIAAGVFAPMPTEAAAAFKGKVKIEGWYSATKCMISVPQQKADRAQYKIFTNAKKLKKTSKAFKLDDYYDIPSQYIDIIGLPKNACSYISVRLRKNGKWTKWTPKLLVIPQYHVSCITTKPVYNKSKRTATISWKKITGVTYYDLYLQTSSSGKLKKVKTFTQKSKTSYTFKNAFGKAFKDNTYYYYKIIARRKVGGKWYKSDVLEGGVSGSFGFNLKPVEE